MIDLSSFAQESFALYLAVKRASEELLAIRERMRQGEQIEKFLKKDFWESCLSEADLRSQELAIEEMKKYYPDDIYVAEEGVTITGDENKPHSVLDPIDGTRHFLDPDDLRWAVTFARHRRNSRVGVIMRPALKDWFLSAVVGENPVEEYKVALRFSWNGCQALHVSRVYPFWQGKSARVLVCQPEKYVRLAEALQAKGFEVVPAGPCTFACIEVACGKADAYVAPGGYGAGGIQHPNMWWDYAAGGPLIDAAYGYTTQMSGKPVGFAHTSFLASNNFDSIHQELITIVRPFTPENNFGRD